jgi:hypothetical protein
VALPARAANSGYRFRSIFSPASRQERDANFQAYWAFCVEQDGKVFPQQKDLEKKREILAWFKAHPVRTRQPLSDPTRFYRNHVVMRDDPRSLDRKTLLLTFLYKFARHEYVGISAAWAEMKPLNESAPVVRRIGLYHLSEEFCHMRLFQEIFATFHLEAVEFVPLGKWMSRMYRVFPMLPDAMLDPPAFVSELMGLTVYTHIDRVLDDILGDEPAACERVRALLGEVMSDEVAHVGHRRNFLGPLGLRAARLMVAPMNRAFLRDMPEARLLFDVDQMVRDGQAFDYSTISPTMLERTWVPSYCKA